MISHQYVNSDTSSRKPDVRHPGEPAQVKTRHHLVGRQADSLAAIFNEYWQELWQQPALIGEQLDQIA
jgi:hypothetical protein